MLENQSPESTPDDHDKEAEQHPIEFRGWSRKPIEPLVVAGKRSKKISALHDEMEAYLVSKGCRLKHVSVAELTRLPRGYKHAIPPRCYWPLMADLIKNVWEPLRDAVNAPLRIRAYRPPNYNRRVNGADKSRHMFFCAMDLRCEPHMVATLKREACKLMVANGKRHEIGLGLYNNSIHIDAGWRRRSWGPDRDLIKQAKES